KAARADKNPQAVAIGARKKLRNRVHQVVPTLDPQSVPENHKSPDPQSVPTRSGHKVYPLSISRAGARDPEARATPQYAGYSALPLELRFIALGLPVPGLAGVAAGA